MTTTHVHPAVSLDEFGDVLTDGDLSRLMHRAASWPTRERADAKQQRRAPDLPPEVPGSGRRSYRYRKQDVAHWLATGRRARKAS